MPGRGMSGRGDYGRSDCGYNMGGYGGMGYQQQGYQQQGGERQRKRIDFSRLHRDNFGYYNICFQKPDEKFNIQEAKAIFEEYGKVGVVHCAAKTVFIRFVERDSAEAALLDLMDSDKFERLQIPYPRQQGEGGSRDQGSGEEQDVVLRNLPEGSTEEDVMDMLKEYDASRVRLQVKEDKTEAMVKFPSEEKAKQFIDTLGEGGVVAKMLAPRKRKVEPLGYGDDIYYYDAAGNYMEPLESEPRVVELWVGNYPKETTREELEGWFKKFGGTTYMTMKEKKDKNWGFAFLGMKSVNQARRAINELHQKKVGSYSIGVRLSQSEQMNNPGLDVYGSGDGNGYGGGGGGMSDMQMYEENIRQLRRNAKIQRASHLARGADFMLAEVLDDCSQCGTISTMMKELCTLLEEMLPPGTAAPTAADFQHLSAGTQKPVPLLGSPRSPAAAQPDMGGSPMGMSMQDQLNQINVRGNKQPGSYPHGKARGHHPKHAAFHH